MKNCPYCNEEIKGRSDKKFCSPYCKSSFHYKKSLEKDDNIFRNIDQQLKRNRRILKSYNKEGKATIRKEILLADGFNPKYFTHYWKNQNNEIYLFCYEFGFLEKKEGAKSKYVLVQWQAYMDKYANKISAV